MSQGWTDISQEESYRLSMAEFKGATIQALQDLGKVQGIQGKQIASLQKSIQNVRIVSGVVGAMGGIITAFLTGMGIKQ